MEILGWEHIGAEMARNTGGLRYLTVRSGHRKTPELWPPAGHFLKRPDRRGSAKLPQALFGTQRSLVQIRAARLESRGVGDKGGGVGRAPGRGGTPGRHPPFVIKCQPRWRAIEKRFDPTARPAVAFNSPMERLDRMPGQPIHAASRDPHDTDLRHPDLGNTRWRSYSQLWYCLLVAEHWLDCFRVRRSSSACSRCKWRR